MFLMAKVRKFLKEINYDTTLKSLHAYALKNEWNIVYFNTASGDALLKTVNISNVPDKEGFLYEAQRIIFVNGNLSEIKKRLVIIHELAHIILKHSQSFDSEEQKEISAQMFVCGVVRAKRFCFSYKVLALVIISLVVTFSSLHFYTKETEVNGFIHNGAERESVQSVYYVTPAGAKYHTANCRYVKNNKIEINAVTAKQMYEPCRVCNPEN